ncbi:agl cluster protein AglQ [Natrialba hulunbeirensis JCM 10989]|uniref:Agl cluster protein AglQ n=1 Tax=Natrialba hulunbeirensis JCM 10989 TaxID=1227493 RepID=M0AB86_9EURY|nr:agl cluster protein AglQ [Natrialba hulunbeirensis JCM 10989]
MIGQAWTIEALVEAAEYFDRPELVALAEEVFLLHPFDEELAAWKYVDIDGEFQSLDKTFNHQLWFAMAGALLADHTEASPIVEEQVRRFLEELPDNLNLYPSGLIFHPFKPEFDIKKYAKIFAEGVRSGVAHKMVSNVAQAIVGGEEGDPMKETSVGYHSFNMYAFAVLHEYFPNHPFWGHEKFERALAYARSERFKDQLDKNPYGYPYNCTGIEMAYVLDVFADDARDLQKWWLEEQFRRTLDPETMEMSRNNPDPATLTARLYEATRLPDIELSIETDIDDDN